jgi:hypothetical protein
MSAAVEKSGLLSTREAATFLRIRPQTLCMWRSTHRYSLPYVKVGRRVFYEVQSLREFIARRRVVDKASRKTAGVAGA